MKRFFPVLFLVFMTVGFLTAAAPVPDTSFTLLEELPPVMNVGDVHTVVVQVNSDQEFISVTSLPSFEYAGKGVVAIQGGDRSGRGTSATLELTFKAKSATARMANGFAPVHVVVGVRYGGGYVAVQEYVFNVVVP